MLRIDLPKQILKGCGRHYRSLLRQAPPFQCTHHSTVRVKRHSLQKMANPYLCQYMRDLLSFLRQIVSLPPSEESKFLSIAQPCKVQKGDYLVREGEVPQKLAFVHKGLFRYFYLDKSGREFTKNFLPEGQLVVSYSAMIAQKPSRMYIEALEDSIISTIHYTDWVHLKNGHPDWNLFLIALLEHAFSVKEARERELLLLEATQRYELFLKEFPQLESRVKQHMVASYLGISPISLSRLKNKPKPLT